MDLDFSIAQKNKLSIKDVEAGPSPSQKGGRRNIRALVSDECLAEATQRANKEEQERIGRLEEQKTRFEILSQSQSFASQSQEENDVEPLILDFDVAGQPLITVHPKLVERMKPHQREGIQFMWESCYESVARLKADEGTGCILAHCMGLGKTFQVNMLLCLLLLIVIKKSFKYLIGKGKNILKIFY